ncbi:MAG: B12-binding domain-containing radical SAM protein [Bacillota bacterium]
MTKSVDLLLVRPNDKKNIYGQLAESVSAIEPPLWAALIAAYVREKGYSAAICDTEAENMSPEDSAAAVITHDPMLVCVVVTGSHLSASTWKMHGAGLLIRAIREKAPGTKVMLWGLHPSALPEQTLLEENVDFVCQGEGFYTITGLLKCLKSGGTVTDYNIPGLWLRKENGVTGNPSAPLVQNLDDLPMAAWDLLPMEKYRAHNWHCFHNLSERQPYAVIYTSLGCPFSCSFCALKSLFGSPGVRFRSPEKVVEEIEFLVKNYSIKNIKILDECFVLKPGHVLNICNRIIDKGFDLNMWAYARINTINEKLLYTMKRAGIKWLCYGIESGSEKILNGVSKGGYDREKVKKVIEMTRSAGINVVGNFMFGLPDDDLETMRDTLNLAKELNCEYTNFYCTMAHPGSQLYDDAVRNGVRLPDSWLGYSQYSEETLPLPTGCLPGEEVLRFRDQAFREFHASHGYLEMVEQKFGRQVVEHIKEALSKEIKRKYT